MQLSPVTSYYLRKLLRQRSDRLQGTAHTCDPSPQRASPNLDKVLGFLCQKHTESGHIAQKLEGLVSIHQELEKQGNIYSKDLASVEDSIFRVLGFEL